MFDLLYDFYFGTIFNILNVNAVWLYDTELTFFGLSGVTILDYLSFICSLISLVIILVLCCLFVYKIIKLIGGLIR